MAVSRAERRAGVEILEVLGDETPMIVTRRATLGTVLRVVSGLSVAAYLSAAHPVFADLCNENGSLCCYNTGGESSIEILGTTTGSNVVDLATIDFDDPSTFPTLRIRAHSECGTCWAVTSGGIREDGSAYDYPISLAYGPDGVADVVIPHWDLLYPGFLRGHDECSRELRCARE